MNSSLPLLRLSLRPEVLREHLLQGPGGLDRKGGEGQGGIVTGQLPGERGAFQGGGAWVGTVARGGGLSSLAHCLASGEPFMRRVGSSRAMEGLASSMSASA